MATRDDKPATQATAASNARALVVGVGASAGGLDAFSRFLANVPANSGMTFVLVQHLDPRHRSLLVELLRKHTSMRVTEAADGIELVADRVFVIPPDATLTMDEGRLRVAKPAPPPSPAPPDRYVLRIAGGRSGRKCGLCRVVGYRQRRHGGYKGDQILWRAGDCPGRIGPHSHERYAA